MILYLHGFNSSPASFKARLLQQKLAALGRGGEFLAPALPHRPAAAVALLETLLDRHPGAALVGSSLGGYYATWLAERHELKAVLVNPAVQPYELLASYLGRQRNLYTGEEYDFTAGHLAELRALEVERVTPERYLLLLATGDEVLDYRQALARYRGCRQVLVAGGDHAFSAFAEHLDTVLAFCADP